MRDFVEEHPLRAAHAPDGGQVCIDLLKHCLDKGSKARLAAIW